MDSCHIFNFLFGTKKATTELSKCFSNFTAQRRSRSRNSRNESRHNDPANESTAESTQAKSGNRSRSCCAQEQLPRETPPSPLKQLQMKLSGLAPAFHAKQSESSKGKRGVSCDAKCGTYRATLVELVEDNSELEGPLRLVDSSQDNAASKDDQSGTNSFRQAIDKPMENARASCVTLVENPSNCYNHEFIASQELENFSEKITKNDIESSSRQMRSVLINNTNDSYSSTLASTNEVDIDDSISNETTRDKPVSFKRVIMYSDKDIDLKTEQEKVVASSAQVYKLVSEYGDARAKLRRVSSVSIDGQVKNHSFDEDDDDKQVVDENNNNIGQSNLKNGQQDKRNIYVRNLVNSFENGTIESENRDCKNQFGFTKPVTLVKPMPPPPPPKHIVRGAFSRKSSQCLSFQLRLNKPLKIQDLFKDETFLKRYFFDKLEPLDRSNAAQVCRSWRNILYSNPDYWKGLVNVIDCTQLRREHLVECIMNTIESAKLRHLQQKSIVSSKDKINQEEVERQKHCSIDSYFNFDLDHDDIWKIQELCNKFTTNHHRIHSQSSRQQLIKSDSNEQTNHPSSTCIANSKSSSIPSQISSTLSSVSISSLLSPLSESSRIDSIKEKLYTSLDNRGFDALCLFGASDEDVEELVYKIPASAHKRILVARLNNCSFTDRGLELLITTFCYIEELELSGCNEITNGLELKDLINLKRLIITDCINVADGIVQNLIQIADQLNVLTIQAYHLTDAFLEYLCSNSDTSRLTRLELPNCKEITNQSLVTMAKYLSQLEVLSISGSTKISDDGIEILAEQARQLKSLDLSWCTRITDASLECIACDLGDTLTDLILDRNIHITDIGIGYLSTMSRLTLLHIRWCPQITDIGLESLLSVRPLEYLSLAGIHQITARSLLCLVETNLVEIELTNCPAVNNDLIMFLSAQMPRCNIIF